MDDAARQLPDDPQALKQIIAQRDGVIAQRDGVIAQRNVIIAERDGVIAQERAAHAAEIQTLREDNALLQHRLKLLLRSSYGPRAERFDPRQLLLFGLRVPPIDPAGPAGASGQSPDAADQGPAAGEKHKPHGRRKLPEHLHRIRIEHDLEEADKPCPCCGGQRHKIGEQITDQLEHIPSNLVVLQHARIKYACKHCNSGSCTQCDGQAHIDIADKPLQPIERGLAGPGLLAHVVTCKLADHLPLYRIQQIFARQQVDISRSTLCGWMKAAAEVVTPLYDLMCQRVRQAEVIHTDDTTVPVMDEDHCRTGRLWTYLSNELHRYTVYHYTPTRKGDGPLAWLGDWKGYLQADAYAGYDAVYAKGVKEVACWAHCRRHFFEAKESDSIRSAQMLGMIQQLYAVEKAAEFMTATQRAGLRMELAKPILDRIKLWLTEHKAQVLPRSPMGQAITYALNQWPALCVYLGDGRLKIDNNAAERALRRVAIGRKNWLWAGTDESAQAHAVLWSLIASAQQHELDVQLYLRSVLAHLPATPNSQLEQLLPDIWKRDLMAKHTAQLQAHHSQILSASKNTPVR
jgi:transposase